VHQVNAGGDIRSGREIVAGQGKGCRQPPADGRDDGAQAKGLRYHRVDVGAVAGQYRFTEPLVRIRIAQEQLDGPRARRRRCFVSGQQQDSEDAEAQLDGRLMRAFDVFLDGCRSRAG
jgi:hypothetical protein